MLCSPTALYVDAAMPLPLPPRIDQVPVYTPAMRQLRPDFLNLSVAERIQLAEDIWDSIAAESPESTALTPAQQQALQSRLQEHDEDPSTAVPWDQVRSELFQRNH